MTEVTKVSIFEGKQIRRISVDNEWWFSVVDIVAFLTDSPDAGAYWRKLKQRLVAEGSQVVTFCHGLKLMSSDGKKYKTDCANTEGIFRIIQSIPSPKAEPFKLWLAKIAKERIDEIENSELGMDRVKSLYGMPVKRSIYMFPKHILGTPESSIGVMGGTFIEGATAQTPNNQEFDAMIARSREFFGT